jgi:hypothetical protein
MRLSSYVVIGSMVIAGFLSAPAYAEYKDLGNSTFTFYPESMTYVDRSDPGQDFGTETYFKVGDEALGYYEQDGESYYSTLNAARTYIKFSTADFQEVFSNYTLTSAALHMYLTSSTDGSSPNTDERINVRAVTSADTLDYMSGLTWDAQSSHNVIRGSVYATNSFNTTSEASGEKIWVSAGNATISELIDGWTTGAMANYGIALENDFDARLQELNATKYSVQNPDEINEIEAYFSKGDKYPRLWVNVAPKVVPEPVSSILMLVGFGVFGIASRMKKL